MFRFLQLAYLRNKETIRRRTKVQSRHCTGGRSRHFVISRLYIHAAVVSEYCHDVGSSEPKYNKWIIFASTDTVACRSPT